MKTFETFTQQLLISLPISRQQLDDLITAIEWEKELSWSNGYADSEEQSEEKVPQTFGNMG
jgi:hypothetical protein